MGPWQRVSVWHGPKLAPTAASSGMLSLRLAVGALPDLSSLKGGSA
jgi:hypothetical protein